MAAERLDIPAIVGGREIRTGRRRRRSSRTTTRTCSPTGTRRARPRSRARSAAAAEARREWSSWRWEDRAAVLLKAAELLAGPWRATLNAATMLGQSKTAFQAEIDSACEVIDFWRFNAHYAQELYGEQPLSAAGVWNQLEYRAARRLRLRDHAVQLHRHRRQPADRARAHGQHGRLEAGLAPRCSSGYYVMKLLEEAGLPPGVINFVPGDAAAISDALLSHQDLAGVHFTGSTGVFNSMWKTIGANMARYRSYPRIVGETGGKDFIVAHASADPAALAVAHRARRLRVPGPEVLGGQPRLRPAVALERRARPRGRDDRATSRWATCRTSGTSWAP